MPYQYVLYLISFIIVIVAQIYLKRQYRVYSEVACNRKITGAETARKILDKNGLSNIKVTTIPGELTDHYSPKEQIIRLSDEVYHGTSIASIAVAAHECGHAIQYQQKYFPIMLRNTIVPIVNLASKLGYIVLVIGLIASLLDLAMIGIIMLSITVVFQLITLPVEFNASRRAKKQLIEDGIIIQKEQSKVSHMLNAAALTYVAGLISSLLEILRLFLSINRNRD